MDGDLTMRSVKDGFFHCSLCGFEFEKHDTPCVRSCPLGKFCNLICCPNCRYEFPAETQPFGWLQRLFHREKRATLQHGTLGLDELEEGEESELVCLNCAHANRRNALAVYGLVPGTRLLLHQKRPSFVVRVGETELALEAEIAHEILVKPIAKSCDAPF
jgi:Fe2+ transport system protein FeoA